jgi:mRNA-degrading endonuclease toxin of MazEF toxin-antitoxin module
VRGDSRYSIRAQPGDAGLLATVCPITAARSEARYPGDVALPVGEAGQTRDGVIVSSQVRTISLQRIRSAALGVLSGRARRRAVRHALAHHLGFEMPAVADGARWGDQWHLLTHRALAKVLRRATCPWHVAMSEHA